MQRTCNLSDILQWLATYSQTDANGLEAGWEHSRNRLWLNVVPAIEAN